MLTDKQKAYAQARVDGKNKTQAAIAAGYSPSTAQPASSRLEKDPAILAHIARLGGLRPKENPKKKTPVPYATHDFKPVENQPVNPESPKKLSEPAPVAEKLPVTESSVPYAGDDLRRQDDPLVWLTNLMNDSREDTRLRADAAKALLPYVHQKKGEEGKKEAKEREAKETGKGKFAAGQRPANVSPIRK